MPNTQKCQVLIVEDCDDLRDLEVSLVSNSGRLVHSAANGKEALDILSHGITPCLILLDLMMPIMNGRQFLNTIKDHEDYSKIPIVIVSAIADLADTSGSVGHMKKPIDKDALMGFVDQYCEISC